MELVVCQKIVLYDLHQEKVHCYTQFKMYSTLKTHILTKSKKNCEKSLKIIKNISVIGVRKKNNKTFCQKKSFSVFGEA